MEEFFNNQVPIKICNCCGLDLPITDFGKNIRSPDGYSRGCRACMKARAASRPKTKAIYDPEVHKRQYPKNRDRLIACSLKWNRENKDRKMISSLKYNKSPLGLFGKDLNRAILKAIGPETEGIEELFGVRAKAIFNYLVGNLPCGLKTEEYSKKWTLGFIRPPSEFDLSVIQGRRLAFNLNNIVAKFKI